MRLGDKRGGPLIRYPDLHRAQPLPAEPPSVLAHTVTGWCHTLKSQVTMAQVHLLSPSLSAGGSSPCESKAGSVRDKGGPFGPPCRTGTAVLRNYFLISLNRSGRGQASSPGHLIWRADHRRAATY